MRFILVSLLVGALPAPAAATVEASFPFKTQRVGKWLVYASFGYCTMLYEAEEKLPKDRVTLSLTYSPNRKTSILTMSGDNLRQLVKNHRRSITASFRFGGSRSDVSGSASVFAPSGLMPSFILSVDDAGTVALLDALRRSKDVAVTADERSLGPYALDATVEAVDKLMECAAAADG